MPRFFMRLAYDGTAYSGWQRQLNAISIQQVIEDKISILLRLKTTIIGCGRTDAGVHATSYYAHFDHPMVIDCETTRFKLNNMLPPDVVIEKISEVNDELHARYSAQARSYIYTVSKQKPLLDRNNVYHYYLYDKLDHDRMSKAADLVSKQREFEPYCKTGTDVKTKTCYIQESKLVFDSKAERIEYHITSNRFLRAMVRLLTGMILNVGRGSVTLDEVQNSFDKQTKLRLDWSVPARGLRLSRVVYPEELLDPNF